MPSRIHAAASVNFAQRISCQPSNNPDRSASSNTDSLPMHFSLDFFFPHDGYKMPSNRTPEAKYDHLSDFESDDVSSFLKLRSTSHHWGQSRGLVVGLCGIIAALLTALFVMVWQHMASPRRRSRQSGKRRAADLHQTYQPLSRNMGLRLLVKPVNRG